MVKTVNMIERRGVDEHGSQNSHQGAAIQHPEGRAWNTRAAGGLGCASVKTNRGLAAAHTRRTRP